MEARARIVIDLARGGSEPEGELSVAGEPGEQRFVGWIGLISTLERAIGARRNLGEGGAEGSGAPPRPREG